MTNAIIILQTLQTRIAAQNEPEWPDEYTQKLYFVENQGLFHLEYYGMCFDEPYEEFLDAVCHPNVAPSLRSLVLKGPDEGANGTRNWDLSRFAKNDAAFPNLLTFVIEPSPPEYHNQTVVAEIYDEEGQIARAVAKMPLLQSLTVPSAPSVDFFTNAPSTLQSLRVESGYDHQNFIQNLSRSHRFPELTSLDFGDYNQRYMEDYKDRCTPFSDYEQLFQSLAFANVKQFFLRNSQLSADEMRTLGQMRPELQLFQIQSYGNYVR